MLQATRLGEGEAYLLDPPAALFKTLEEEHTPERFRVDLVLRGQTPGMLLQLGRGERRPHHALSGVEGMICVFSDLSFAVGMQDEERRRGLAALQQEIEGGMQGFDRPPEDQDGFACGKPAAVILKQFSPDAESRSPYPGCTRKGAMGLNPSLRVLAHPRSTAEALPLQLPEGCPSLILPGKTANENACFHASSVPVLTSRVHTSRLIPH